MTRLHRFYIDQYIGEQTHLVVQNRDLLNQWGRVLRLKEESGVVLFDGSGFEFMAIIKKISNKEVLLEIKEKKEKVSKLNFELQLAPSLIKRDHFELVLEKGTELGVSKFLPIISERSVKLDLNLERSRKIIKESAEQSGKTRLPDIEKPHKLKEFLTQKKVEVSYIAFDPRGNKFSKDILNKNKIIAFVGPEGGFSEKEIEMFKKKNVPIYSLGEQILRAETASISISSNLLLDF